MNRNERIETLRSKSRTSLLAATEHLPHDEGGHQSHKHSWLCQVQSFPQQIGLAGVMQVSPLLSLLKSYTRSTLLSDVRAALTVSFVLLPQAIAYAPLANVPPISALLSAVFPLIVYSLLGSSGQLGIGPEAMTSVLVGITVHEEMKLNPDADPAAIASAMGVFSGLLGIVLAVFQAGYIDNVLSGYLLTGFVLGVSNLVMIEQLPALFGLPPSHGLETESAVAKLISHLKEIPRSNLSTVFLGLSCLMYLFLARYLKKKLSKRIRWVAFFPDILLLVLLSIGLSVAIDFKNYNIKVLGPISSSLSTPKLPSLDWGFLNRNLAQIITVTVAGFVESQTVTRNLYGILT
jgi:MFS superfamily sulfate permease-like transporter